MNGSDNKDSAADKLNERQKKFCEEYVLDWNGTRAYKDAGYQAKNDNVAAVQAHHLLRNPNILAYIEECKRNTAQLAGVSALLIANEHKKIALSSATDLRQGWYTAKDFESLTEAQKACISGIETVEKVIKREGETAIVEQRFKIKTYDKQKSLDALAKMFSYNAPEQVNHSGKINFTLPTGSPATSDSDAIE